MFLDQIVVLTLFEIMIAKFTTLLAVSFWNSPILTYMMTAGLFQNCYLILNYQRLLSRHILPQNTNSRYLPHITLGFFVKTTTVLPNGKRSDKITSVTNKQQVKIDQKVILNVGSFSLFS